MTTTDEPDVGVGFPRGSAHLIKNYSHLGAVF
jgi:hypothetical protein